MERSDPFPADPELVVMELSEQKAEGCSIFCTGESIILGADTVVSVDGEILGEAIGS